ncbi:YdeI/OmpD-associated family protein [Roseinatronobacter alkalisoli]|uniref:YdeI/OmpD-associated family protein n=1 Tax=Roseinatronobacter alkalisoli TaxID=3028235 RepID=A0ABT5T638_9RHOB|nr:YdeI/OmpD-associated family protein [Roseinatronobacter sp. HJB301]MDD7970571.1 YdeI/OmpD-associated family protein [Roseinatronobacter sp. HJB301]
MARPRAPMPQDVADALQARGLQAAYDARPPYQRNDWLIWIDGAKRPETRARRLESMLTELQAGTGYMGMPWRPRSTGKPG